LIHPIQKAFTKYLKQTGKYRNYVAGGYGDNDLTVAVFHNKTWVVNVYRHNPKRGWFKRLFQKRFNTKERAMQEMRFIMEEF